MDRDARLNRVGGLPKAAANGLLEAMRQLSVMVDRLYSRWLFNLSCAF